MTAGMKPIRGRNYEFGPRALAEGGKRCKAPIRIPGVGVTFVVSNDVVGCFPHVSKSAIDSWRATIHFGSGFARLNGIHASGAS
jgi:hypothetical protein